MLRGDVSVGARSLVVSCRVKHTDMNTFDAFIGLGSNLGDRSAFLRSAMDEMGLLTGTRVVAVSSFHETAPVGGPPGQGRYLNAVACVRTRLDAPILLKGLQRIERRLGRVRTIRNGPRTLDLDLLLYGDRSLAETALTVPHPRMASRLFVLQPLCELAPGLFHPTLGCEAAKLLARCVEAGSPSASSGGALTLQR